ncbi:MAG TPA: hypothetical protein VFC78_22140 [Tepidisphaeraceae bacterium]|nr:hypothetical protein [Tepidisphaeraceae bacterium]
MDKISDVHVKQIALENIQATIEAFLGATGSRAFRILRIHFDTHSLRERREMIERGNQKTAHAARWLKHRRRPDSTRRELAANLIRKTRRGLKITKFKNGARFQERFLSKIENAIYFAGLLDNASVLKPPLKRVGNCQVALLRRTL